MCRAKVPDSGYMSGTSTLTAAVADQAQLHGILTRIRDLGVILLAVDAVALEGRGTGE